MIYEPSWYQPSYQHLSSHDVSINLFFIINHTNLLRLAIYVNHLCQLVSTIYVNHHTNHPHQPSSNMWLWLMPNALIRFSKNGLIKDSHWKIAKCWISCWIASPLRPFLSLGTVRCRLPVPAKQLQKRQLAAPRALPKRDRQGEVEHWNHRIIEIYPLAN